jgi:hypothetical protein
MSFIASLKSVRSAGSAGFDDHIAIRQLGTHAHCTALRMVPLPAVVMAVIDMFANHNIVTIADNNLCGRRHGARKDSNSRT